MKHVELADVRSNHAGLRFLINQLDRYLFELYPPEEVFLVNFEDPHIDEIEFVIAYHNGNPVGCGAIKKIDAKAMELKRFYVLENYRNQGIAGMILDRLENKARNKHYEVMRLETGMKQTEAIGCYRKYGYYKIDLFGEYVGCPSSICMERKL